MSDVKKVKEGYVELSSGGSVPAVSFDINFTLNQIPTATAEISSDAGAIAAANSRDDVRFVTDIDDKKRTHFKGVIATSSRLRTSSGVGARLVAQHWMVHLLSAFGYGNPFIATKFYNESLKSKVNSVASSSGAKIYDIKEKVVSLGAWEAFIGELKELLSFHAYVTANTKALLALNLIDISEVSGWGQDRAIGLAVTIYKIVYSPAGGNNIWQKILTFADIMDCVLAPTIQKGFILPKTLVTKPLDVVFVDKNISSLEVDCRTDPYIRAVVLAASVNSGTEFYKDFNSSETVAVYPPAASQSLDGRVVSVRKPDWSFSHVTGQAEFEAARTAYKAIGHPSGSNDKRNKELETIPQSFANRIAQYKWANMMFEGNTLRLICPYDEGHLVSIGKKMGVLSHFSPKTQTPTQQNATFRYMGFVFNRTLKFSSSRHFAGIYYTLINVHTDVQLQQVSTRPIKHYFG